MFKNANKNCYQAKMHSGNVGKDIKKSSLKFADCFSPQKKESANIIFNEGKKS
jgi:hypothetical protein